MLPDLKDPWDIPGVWTVYYSNQDSITCAGKLYFKPNDKIYLELIIEKKSLTTTSVYDSIFKKLSIEKIVGKTQKGTFFLFDAFPHGSKFGYTIVEYNILSNISCLVSSNLTLGDEYRQPDDIANEDENLFYEGHVRFTGLFDWLLQNSHSINAGYIYKTCEHCNSKQLIENYFEWVDINLNGDTSLKINVHYDHIEFRGLDEVRTPNISISIITREPQSIRFFTRLSWSLKHIFSVLTDTCVNIERIDLFKKWKNDDHYKEFHRLFFVCDKTQCNFNADYPVRFKSKKELSLYIKNSFEMCKDYPDFFANMEKNINETFIEKQIIALTQVIDASFKTLYGRIAKSDYTRNLKKKLQDALSRDKFSDEERENIIGNSCRVNLADKLKLFVEESFKILKIPYTEKNNELLNMAKIVRNKQSHGDFYRHFSGIPVPFDDMCMANTILKHSVYVLFLRAIGVDDEQICAAFRNKTMHALANYDQRRESNA